MIDKIIVTIFAIFIAAPFFLGFRWLFKRWKEGYGAGFLGVGRRSIWLVSPDTAKSAEKDVLFLSCWGLVIIVGVILSLAVGLWLA